MKIKTDWTWVKDDNRFYILPLLGFSWGKAFGRSIWLGWLKFLVSVHFEEKKDKTGSKAYCPCGHEILQDPLSKIYEGGAFTNIICFMCNVQTTWDLDAPVPIFIEAKTKSLPEVEMTDKQFKTVCKMVEQDITEKIIHDYMEIFKKHKLPEQAWLEIGKVNGKYLNG